MAYEISGFVTFEFTNVVVDEDDPYEARHEVERMSADELLDYADSRGSVQVTKMRTVS